MGAFKILVLMTILASPTFGETQIFENPQNIILAQSATVNCGLKPIPKIGYEIGRCVNGQWEQVSKRASGTLDCGLKPIPNVGYEIGRCVNGQWEQVSKRAIGTLDCGLKPIPKIGYEIGRCVNGQWEQVSR